MNIIHSKTLNGMPAIAHGFFGREGGVSTGIYTSLNCGPGSDDARAAVIANRESVRGALGADALVTLHQVHSAGAIIVTAPWNIGDGPQCDAMVSTTPGIALGILTADCAPVLFADEAAGVIGAAHAGWKGALGGVIEATLQAMERLGAERGRIAAAIGPCISQANYEVGPEFRARFASDDPANTRFFIASDKADHFRFDLEGFVAARLAAAHVSRIEPLSTCTYAQEHTFFSYRRATHRGETGYGRQISAIMLTS